MTEDLFSAPERSPYDAKPLDADEYRELLEENPPLVLRVSDGTGDGTFRFWVEDGTLFWRCLNWTSPQKSDTVHLSATLDDDSTTQLLIERSMEGVAMSESDTERQTDPRPRLPTTVDEWTERVKSNDEAVLIHAENQSVFVAWVETDEFPEGGTWISKSADPESGRLTQSVTTDNLVRRWFEEGISARIYPLPYSDTPFDLSRYTGTETERSEADPDA